MTESTSTGVRHAIPPRAWLAIALALLCVVVVGVAVPLRAATSPPTAEQDGSGGATITAAARDLQVTATAAGHLERTDERTIGHGGTVTAGTARSEAAGGDTTDSRDSDAEAETAAAAPVVVDGDSGIVLTSAHAGDPAPSHGGESPPCPAETYGGHPSEAPEPCPSEEPTEPGEEPSEEPSEPGEEPSEEPSTPSEEPSEPGAQPPEQPPGGPTAPGPTTPGPQQQPGAQPPSGGQQVMPGGQQVLPEGRQMMPAAPTTGAAPDGRSGTGVEELVEPAVLTGLTELGATVERGTVLYEAGAEPVVALMGSVPVWRKLETGVDNGADVRQLERNLDKLGYGDDLTVDREFTAATAEAVEDWERDLGREDPDGVVEPGDVVYLSDTGSVIRHDAAVGETLTAGTSVLTISGDAQLVIADVPVESVEAWSPGTPVELRWDDRGDVTTGAISGIGRDATGSGDDATVEVVVALDEQVRGRPDQSEVTVALTTATRQGAVAVPVTAIVAGDDGGPAVRVVDGATGRLVDVTTGLVDGGWIEVVDGLAVGDVVRIPG